MISEKEITTYLDFLQNYLLEFTPKLITAVFIFIIGFWITSIVTKLAKKVMHKRNVSLELISFLGSLLFWGLRILVIITVISKLGIETTSFVAILGALGLAIGLALQGSLSNFAGGVLILFFKPYKINDLIEAQEEIGVVSEIGMFTTKLVGLSNKEIIIPNGILSNGTIVNYSVLGTRRVDLIIGVSYEADIKQVKEVLMAVLKNNSKILTTPEPIVNVLELATSSVNFAVRPWCNSGDYWDVYFEITENIKLALDAANIEIPYPHQVEINKVIN
jgi:small conductance mechanosensitive channel